MRLAGHSCDPLFNEPVGRAHQQRHIYRVYWNHADLERSLAAAQQNSGHLRGDEVEGCAFATFESSGGAGAGERT